MKLHNFSEKLLEKIKKNKALKSKNIDLGSSNDVVTKKIEIYLKKLKITNCFLETKIQPHWMTFKFLPVLPPNIRPIVKLEDKRIITTDLNQLYSKIININNKISKLKKMMIQKKYLNNEKLVLEESVSELIINSEKTKTNLRLTNILIISY